MSLNFEEKKTRNNPPKRRNHSSAIDPEEQKLFIYGGVGERGHDLRDLWFIDLNNYNEWKEIETNNKPSHNIAQIIYDNYCIILLDFNFNLYKMKMVYKQKKWKKINMNHQHNYKLWDVSFKIIKYKKYVIIFDSCSLFLLDLNEFSVKEITLYIRRNDMHLRQFLRIIEFQITIILNKFLLIHKGVVFFYF